MPVVPCPASSTIANWKNTPIRLQFFSMAPHTTVRKNLKRFGGTGEAMAEALETRGEIADSVCAQYRDCDGLLKAFKSAIKKAIFRIFPSPLAGRKSTPVRGIALFLSTTTRPFRSPQPRALFVIKFSMRG
jgi:hypothetical protein